MLSPTEKELLKKMKIAVIDRYGGMTPGAKALGFSRWQLRRAVLGQCPEALSKMAEAGLVNDIAANSAPGTAYGPSLTLVAVPAIRAGLINLHRLKRSRRQLTTKTT